MTKITQVHLAQLGRVAAEAWDECDQALDQLNQGFGVVYESARDNLTKDINEASKEHHEKDLPEPHRQGLG